MSVPGLRPARSAVESASMSEAPRPKVSLREIARAFGKIGAIGFGGGVGMLALIRQEVVEKRRWVDDKQLGVAVAMGQMLPGPFVSNYAEYIGYELRGGRGMVTAHVALMLPCLVLMLVLSLLYFRYGSMPVVAEGLFGRAAGRGRHPRVGDVVNRQGEHQELAGGGHRRRRGGGAVLQG